MPDSSWIAAITLCVLLGIGGVVVGVLIRRKRREQTAANEQEIERALAEAGAQESLNHLYRCAKGLFGAEYTQAVNRLERAIALLGDTDRSFIDDEMPARYAELTEAAREYDNIMSGRTICDGDVTVHTFDSSGTYTVDVYSQLARTAWALAIKLPTLHDVREEVIDLCVTIERAATLTPRRSEELRNECAVAAEGVRSQETIGYDVRRLKNMLKATRASITKVEGAVRFENFLQAQRLIATAERLLEELWRHIKMMPRLQQDLEQRLDYFDAAINEASDILRRVSARQVVIGGRYTKSIVQPLCRELATLLDPIASLPAKMELLREKLAGLDVFTAAKEAAAIEDLLEQVRQIDEKTSDLMLQQEAARASYRALRPTVVSELNALEEAIQTRESQGYQKRWVRELRTRFEDAERSRRTRPVAAHEALLTLQSAIAHRNQLSLKAHERAMELLE